MTQGRLGSRWALFLVPLLAFLTLSIPGLKFGLPDSDHFYSYDGDEVVWIINAQALLGSKELRIPGGVNPTGYLWPYVGALKIGSFLGYLDPTRTPQGWRPTRWIFRNLYWLGRVAQVVLGSFLLMMLWALALRLRGVDLALIATLFLAVSPAFVTTTHFSYTNIPAATIGFAALALMIRADLAPSRRKLWEAAFVTGFAFGTKYSAFPLALPLAYLLWKSPSKERWRIAVPAGMLVGLGFVLAFPFAVFEPSAFWHEYQRLSAWLKIPVPGFWEGALFPFRYPLLYAVGPALLVAMLLALLRTCQRRQPGDLVLLLFLGGFLVGTYRCGAIASPGRMLIGIVPLFLLLARRIVEWTDANRKRKPWAVLMVAGLIGLTLPFTRATAAAHRSLPPQKAASQWIAENIPPGTPIGVLEEAYYWTPDILYPEMRDRPDYRPLYPLLVMPRIDSLAQAPRYFLVPEVHRHRGHDKTLAWLDSGDAFEKWKVFQRDLRVGPWHWRRREMPYGMTEDDLYVNTLTLYRKRAIPQKIGTLRS